MSRSIHAAQGELLPYHHYLHQFLTFLKHARGFADATIVNRERSLRPFFTWLVAQDVPLSTMSPVVITKYFTGIVAGHWKRTTVSFHVQSLRSFFRYASSRGWCAAGIAESIDAPRLYTYENLPQGPAWEEVKKLLTSVNGTSPVQIRSRCAILLCAVYGFRVGEVCRMRLEDIDWAEERIIVRRPKQRKVQTYPLTTEVGNALLRYLKDVRPSSAHREVFVTLRRPYRPVSVGALSTMTQKLQRRLGLKLKRYGLHVLRHSCATHLLAQGLTLKEVGDHLGHMSVAATRIYAKVDLVSLREVAALDVILGLVELFRALTAPTQRSIQGIWGELFVIHNAADPITVAAAWHRIPEEHYDFAAGPQRLDVKTSSNRRREHHFSQTQLSGPGPSRVIIASLFVERIGGGISLRRLFEQTRQLLADDAVLLTQFDASFYATVGSAWNDAMDESFDSELAEESLAFFDASSVPKVQTPIPRGVSDVRFCSDLSAATPLKSDDLRSLGNLLAVITR